MAAKSALSLDLERSAWGKDSSNPSGSTQKALIIRQLKRSTDKPLTRKMNYKLPEVYDAGGDLEKQWFVYFSVKDPITGKFKRFKKFEDINRFKTKSDRKQRAVEIQIGYSELLREGWTPFRIPTHELIGSGSRGIIDCIDRYLEHIEIGSLSRHTKRKYKVELRIFKKWLESSGLGLAVISDIRKQHIRDFLDHLKKDRSISSGKTINHYLNDIRTFFNFFIDNYDDYLEKNPASKITGEKVITKGNVAYTDQEFAKIKELILETDPYLWRICQVVYYSALRNEAEALNIRIGDFDLKNDRINVPGEIAKGRKLQSIPIYPQFKEVLLTFNLEQYPPEYYLFGRNDQPGPRKVGEDNFARRFRIIKEKLGLSKDQGIYAFKHTRACHLYDDGADLRDIQRLFRHEDLYVTMNYLRTLNRIERHREHSKGRSI